MKTKAKTNNEPIVKEIKGITDKSLEVINDFMVIAATSKPSRAINKGYEAIVNTLLEHIDLQSKEIEKAKADLELMSDKFNSSTITLKMAINEIFGRSSQRTLTLKKNDAGDHVVNEAEQIDDKSKDETKPKVGRKLGSHNNMTDEQMEAILYKTVYIDPEEAKAHPELFDKIGESYAYKLVYEPGRIRSIKYIYTTFKKKETGELIKANHDEDPYFHGLLDPSLVAFLIHLKYVLSIPLYRQETDFARMGIPLSRQTISAYILRTANICEPLVAELQRLLLLSDVIHSDETRLRVIGIKDRYTSFMFVHASTGYYPIRLFKFYDSRKGENARDILINYDGYVVTDKYGGYNFISNERHQYCLGHARGYFVDIGKVIGEKSTLFIPIGIVKDAFDKIFSIEKKFREDKLSVDEIYAARNTQSYKDMISDLKEKVTNLKANNIAKVQTAKDYLLKHFDNFFVYTKTGFVDPTNNLAERTVKDFVIGRKNFLFSNTKRGAEASAILYTVVRTAIANGLDTVKYLEYVITHLHNGAPVSSVLPWSKELPEDLKILGSSQLKKDPIIEQVTDSL